MDVEALGQALRSSPPKLSRTRAKKPDRHRKRTASMYIHIETSIHRERDFYTLSHATTAKTEERGASLFYCLSFASIHARKRKRKPTQSFTYTSFMRPHIYVYVIYTSPTHIYTSDTCLHTTYKCISVYKERWMCLSADRRLPYTPSLKG